MHRTDIPSIDIPETKVNLFTKGARGFIEDAAAQSRVSPTDMIKQTNYAVPRQIDGSLPADAGTLRVEIPGAIDLTKSGRGITPIDLPTWTVVKGDVRVSSDRITALSHGQSLDIDGKLVVVTHEPLTEASRQKILKSVEGLSGISYEDVVVEYASEPVRKSSLLEKTESREQKESKEEYSSRLARMTREEFATYLEDHMKEFADRTENRRLAHTNSINQQTIYNLLTLRPELRGMTNSEQSAYRQLSPEKAAYFLGTKERPGVLPRLIKIEKSRSSSTVTFSESTSLEDSFIHWSFRDSKRKGETRHKAYITLKDPVSQLTPDAIRAVVQTIDGLGFNGQMKMPDNLINLQIRFDNIVIHGNDPAEIQRVVSAAAVELLKHGVQVSSLDQGIDAGGTSHTHLLAKRVVDKINPGRFKS